MRPDGGYSSLFSPAELLITDPSIYRLPFILEDCEQNPGRTHYRKKVRAWDT
jgi:hypothetical protein